MLHCAALRRLQLVPSLLRPRAAPAPKPRLLSVAAAAAPRVRAARASMAPNAAKAVLEPPSVEALSRAARIAALLQELYPPPLAPPLTHRNHFELLCAVVLSAQARAARARTTIMLRLTRMRAPRAQSTDKKVNEITPALFAAAPTPAAMAALPVETIQALIRQVGLAPSKAKYLQGLAAQLEARHGGVVPSSFAELEALPGVGHKTASVVMSQAFGMPAFPVDTHIWRLALRWRLSREGAKVEEVERDLKALWPPHAWGDLHLQFIFFGRQYCPAKAHDAAVCPICSWAAAPQRAQAAAAEPATAAGGPVGAAQAQALRAELGAAAQAAEAVEDAVPGSAAKRRGALPATPAVATPAEVAPAAAKRARKPAGARALVLPE
jgi:endonuclease-3